MKTAQIVGLCVVCSIISSGTVAMMGMQQQPEPPARTLERLTSEPGSPKLSDLFEEVNVADYGFFRRDKEGAALGVALMKTGGLPITAAAPTQGFVLVITPLGGAVVIGEDGNARPVTISGENASGPYFGSVNLRASTAEMWRTKK